MKYFYFFGIENDKHFWFIAKKAKKLEQNNFQIKFDDIFLSDDIDNLKEKMIDRAVDFWGEDRNDPDMFVFNNNSGKVLYSSYDTVNHGLIILIFL